MSLFFSSPDDHDVEQRIARLSHELHELRKLAARRGLAAYKDGADTAADLYGELRGRFEEALPHIRKGARAIERRAHDNPAATALVGLVLVGALAALLTSKRR